VSELYSETCGRGPPLALLHGWGMNLRVFDALRAQLAAHYTVTALDLPGHGRSPWIAGLTPAQQLALLAAQLPHDALLVGWSLGGQLALRLAADGALRVRQLALIACTPRFVRSPDWPHGLSPALLELFAQQLTSDPRRTLTDFLSLQVRGSARADIVLSSLQQALLEHGEPQAPALAAGLQQLQHNDLRALARTLRVPTVVIAGQYDRVTPCAGAQALVELMPQARLLALPRAGHAPFLSHGQDVLAALLALQHGSLDRGGASRTAQPRQAAGPTTP
jgi:pimeloyl-[acyl-carrier protein] methyl ester esterase